MAFLRCLAACAVVSFPVDGFFSSNAFTTRTILRSEAKVSIFAPEFAQRALFGGVVEQMRGLHGAKCSDAAAHARDAKFFADLEERFVEDLPKHSTDDLWRMRHLIITHQLVSLPISGRARTEGATRLAVGPQADLAGGRRRVRPLVHFPGLGAKPWHDHGDFQWLSQLHALRSIVSRELRAALAAGPELWVGNDQAQFDALGWTQVSLSTFGAEHFEASQHFPNTLDLLRGLGVPLGPADCCIVRQAGGSGLPRHTDDRNYFLTAHIPLDSGEGDSATASCALTCDGETRTWSAGGDPTVIDTTFWHKTRNEAEAPVYVLLVDFWHPDLTALERAAMQIFNELDAQYLAETVGADASQPSLRKGVEDYHQQKGR